VQLYQTSQLENMTLKIRALMIEWDKIITWCACKSRKQECFWWKPKLVYGTLVPYIYYPSQGKECNYMLGVPNSETHHVYHDFEFEMVLDICTQILTHYISWIWTDSRPLQTLLACIMNTQDSTLFL